MTAQDDKGYFRERARREREIASTCEDKNVAMVHRRLAEEYDRLGKDGPSGLKAVRDA